MDLKLQGKLVLVTGSTLGIGKAIAKKYVEVDANVIVNGRGKDKVAAVAEEFRQLGKSGKVFEAACDLTTAEGVSQLVHLVDKEIGAPLDVLVNNIGIFESKPFVEISDEEWLHYFDVNVVTVARLARVFLPRMIERNSGNVITISSEAGYSPKDFMVHYCTTKTAQLGLSRALAEMTKGTKVRVNVVCPGPTWTEGVASYIDGIASQKGVTPEETKSNYFKEVEPTSLLQRFIDPEEVANTVVFLSSDLSACISGSPIRAEGGILKYI